MALVKNSAEAGVSAGTAVDATNSAVSGTRFSTFVGSGITYTATAFRGTLAIQVAAASATSTYFSWQSTEIAGATNAAAFRCYMYWPSAIGSLSEPLVYFRTGTGGTGLYVLQAQGTTGKLFLTSDATAGTVGAVATTGLSATTWYRVEVTAANNNAANDSFAIRVYLGDSTTEQTALGTNATGVNLGTSTIGSVRIGRPSTPAQAFTVIYDDLAFQTGSATLIGPGVANVAPTAGAGTDQSVAYAVTVTLTGTDSDTDGTIVTRGWTQISGTTVTLSGSGNSRTFTSPSVPGGATLVFRYSVTDNEGATTTDDMTVTVASSNVLPTSGAGVDQTNKEPYTTVTLTGTDSDSDGTVVTRVWAQTAGSPTVTLAGSGTTRTFTAPGTLAGTTLTFTYTVTDNSGGSSTPDPMTVAVLPVTDRAVMGGVEVPMQIREN